MHTIYYTIVSNDNHRHYASFLDFKKAEDELELANAGFRKKQGWVGESFYLKEFINQSETYWENYTY